MFEEVKSIQFGICLARKWGRKRSSKELNKYLPGERTNELMKKNLKEN